VSPNILESISHELGSAKARIELELGQAVDDKMKHLEDRLTQLIDTKIGEATPEVSSGKAGTGESGNANALEGLESQVRDFRSSVEEQNQNVENRLTAVESTLSQAAPTDVKPDQVPGKQLQSELHAMVERVGNVERMLREVAASPVFSTEPPSNMGGSPTAAKPPESPSMDMVRSEAMWRELTEHAQAAAVRADALERSLMMRIEKIESSLVNVLSHGLNDSGQKKKGKPSEKEDDSLKLGKSLEWLNWRITWLEWATNGEKRSFGRSVDHRAVLPAHLAGDTPPPFTQVATSFSQPITEDCELWARDPRTGARHLRRQLRPQPQGFAEASTGPNGPLRLSGSSSLGRLPRLGV
jgi:hypothetical protein